MPDPASLQRQIEQIFAEKLNLAVPSADTDLFASGGLDSLLFVELLVQLEREYGVRISLVDQELEHFQSIAHIARFMADRLDADGARRAADAAGGARRAEHG